MSLLDILSDPNAALGGYNPATDPNAMALAGLARGFAQAAMPSERKIPFGAALGLAGSDAVAGAGQAIGNQKAQAETQNAQMATALNAAILPSQAAALKSSMSGTGGGAGAYGPQQALNDAFLARMQGDSRRYSAAMDTFRSMVGPGGQWNGQTVDAVPGSASVAAGRAGGVAGAEAGAKVVPTLQIGAGQAAIDVNKAWQMLSPDAQKALTAAGIDVNKAWQMPQSYTPGSTVGSPAQMQGGISIPGVAAQINANEGAGRDPRSSAVGGFMSGTWPSVIRAAFPSMAGIPDAQLLAMRSDPRMRQVATETYAQQNAQALQAAGLPVTPGTLYLAHGFGAGGAQTLLRADPNTPMRALMPEVIPQNPQYANMTAGQVRQMFDQKMAGVTSAAAAPNGPGGGVPAQVPPATAATRADAEAKASGEEDAKVMPTLDAQARESTQAINRIQQVRNALANAQKGGIGSGYFSPELAQAAAAAKSLGINTSALGIDPSAVGNAQAAHEGLVQISGEILKRLFPQRVTNMDIKLYGEALPNMGMDPAALDQVLGIAQKQAQYDVDTARNAHQWRSGHGGSLSGWQDQYYGGGNYGPDLFSALSGAGAIGGPPGGGSPSAPPAAAPASPASTPTAPSSPQGFSLQNPARPTTREEALKLAPGTPYVNPADGRIYIFGKRPNG